MVILNFPFNPNLAPPLVLINAIGANECCDNTKLNAIFIHPKKFCWPSSFNSKNTPVVVLTTPAALFSMIPDWLPEQSALCFEDNKFLNGLLPSPLEKLSAVKKIIGDNNGEL